MRPAVPWPCAPGRTRADAHNPSPRAGRGVWARTDGVWARGGGAGSTGSGPFVAHPIVGHPCAAYPSAAFLAAMRPYAGTCPSRARPRRSRPDQGTDLNPKTVKNRLHLDLATTSAAHQAELVARQRALGATLADIGQGEVPWTVLADPEGNEFCVLTPM